MFETKTDERLYCKWVILNTVQLKSRIFSIYLILYILLRGVPILHSYLTWWRCWRSFEEHAAVLRMLLYLPICFMYRQYIIYSKSTTLCICVWMYVLWWIQHGMTSQCNTCKQAGPSSCWFTLWYPWVSRMFLKIIIRLSFRLSCLFSLFFFLWCISLLCSLSWKDRTV